MVEFTCLSEQLRTFQSEKSLDYPGIRFEPGIHSDDEGVKAIFARHISGDLNVHIWNTEVLERMRKYSPEIIAIDGQSPLSFQGEVQLPEYLWIALPGKPSQINPRTKEVFVVRGDLVSYDYLFSSMGAKWVGKSMQAQDEEWCASYISSSEGRISRDKDVVMVAFLVYLALSLDKKISRRDFLRLGAAIVGAAAFGDLSDPISQNLAAVSKSSEAKDLYTNYSNSFENIFKGKGNLVNYIDYRTALLIAKEEDAIDFLGKPKEVPAAVVMGNGHLSRVNEFMKSKSERLKAISTFTEVIIASLEKILKQNLTISNKDELKTVLLNYISAVEVVKVTDSPVSPDGSFGAPPMTKVGYFQSPQVEEAISKFRR